MFKIKTINNDKEYKTSNDVSFELHGYDIASLLSSVSIHIAPDDFLIADAKILLSDLDINCIPRLYVIDNKTHEKINVTRIVLENGKVLEVD